VQDVGELLEEGDYQIGYVYRRRNGGHVGDGGR